MEHGPDVSKLRAKLWSSSTVAARDWDSPQVARWMDGWHGWGDGSYRAMLDIPEVREKLHSRPCRVLDFGCGPGLLVERVHKHRVDRVVGLDVAQAMVDRLDAKIRAEGWKNVEAVAVDVARAEADVLDGLGPFDLVFSVTVLSFLARRRGDEVAAVSALRRMMAPGALLVHVEWPDGGVGSRSGAGRLYEAASLEGVRAGRATIDGCGVFVGIARRTPARR